MTRRILAASLTVLLSLLAGGCQAGYVVRQGFAQIARLHRQVPLDSPELLEELELERRAKLDLVPEVLDFARRELDLRPGDAYERFLDTEGRPVSYVVVASHPRALIPYRWCFPFVGCVPYKGFFDLEDAKEEADELREDGLDVVVRGVGAYSTLGWFRDPVLSTMLDMAVPDFVEILLHETVHRTLYIKGETELNEGLATYVAREGTRLFLDEHPCLVDPSELRSWETRQGLQDAVQELTYRLRWDLESLYRSDLPPDEIDRGKVELFAQHARAKELLTGQPQDASPSNARVILSQSYHQLVPVLARIMEEQGGHPRDLMAYLQRLSKSGEEFPEELRLR